MSGRVPGGAAAESSMNAGLLHGLWTALLLAAFLAIVVWAWSARRRRDFEEAARLPLEDDEPSRGERGTGDG